MSDPFPSLADFLYEHDGGGQTRTQLQVEYNKLLAKRAFEGDDPLVHEGVKDLEQFQRLVGVTTEGEANRVRAKHRKYYDEHRREVFMGLLTNEYPDLLTFYDVARAARLENPPPNSRVTVQSAGKTVREHVPRLIARILYYRMTCKGTPDEKETDLPPVTERVARENISKKFATFGITVSAKNLYRWCPASGRKQPRRERKRHL